MLTAPADAGRKKKGEQGDAVEQPVPAPKQRSKPIPLWPDELPMAVGTTPAGLANLSAQGCAACHIEAHEDWADGAHASGWRDPGFQRAVSELGSPACARCHLPLLVQDPDLVTFDAGNVDLPLRTPNPGFDATLRLEGVTCAACHVREGKVVASRPPEELGKAPHPLVWSDQLATSEGCAACHQLTWPGADTPLYDTFGEWQRSAYAKAGVRCQDCHGADDDGFDHGIERGASRAVSVLLDLDALDLVRGGDPVPLTLTLQNTGAGHAFPTGSPWVSVAVRAWLEGPPDKKGVPFRSEPFDARLARTLEEVAPWRTKDDTRLKPGETRSFDVPLALPQDAPDGSWVLKVELAEVVRGAIAERPLVARELPLRVR